MTFKNCQINRNLAKVSHRTVCVAFMNNVCMHDYWQYTHIFVGSKDSKTFPDIFPSMCTYAPYLVSFQHARIIGLHMMISWYAKNPQAAIAGGLFALTSSAH